MTDRPPTRYDEEGKSLPERGSGIPSLEAALAKTEASTAVDREPEKLVIPAGSVMWLIMQALKTEAGDAWMRGFVTAHGEPSWIVQNHWGIKATEAVEIVRVNPQATNGVAR